jgi:hypothetical protein
MTAAEIAAILGDARREGRAEAIDRVVAGWQGRIAVAGADGAGLDTFRQALAAIKKDVPADNGLLEKAKAELWDTALRHLEPAVGLGVLASIYVSVMSEPPPDTNDDLDQAVLQDDDRRTVAAEIERLRKLPPIEYDRERQDAAKRLRCRVGALDALHVLAARRQRQG